MLVLLYLVPRASGNHVPILKKSKSAKWRNEGMKTVFLFNTLMCWKITNFRLSPARLTFIWRFMDVVLTCCVRTGEVIRGKSIKRSSKVQDFKKGQIAVIGLSAGKWLILDNIEGGHSVTQRNISYDPPRCYLGFRNRISKPYWVT